MNQFTLLRRFIAYVKEESIILPDPSYYLAIQRVEYPEIFRGTLFNIWQYINLSNQISTKLMISKILEPEWLAQQINFQRSGIRTATDFLDQLPKKVYPELFLANYKLNFHINYSDIDLYIDLYGHYTLIVIDETESLIKGLFYVTLLRSTHHTVKRLLIFNLELGQLSYYDLRDWNHRLIRRIINQIIDQEVEKEIVSENKEYNPEIDEFLNQLIGRITEQKIEIGIAEGMIEEKTKERTIEDPLDHSIKTLNQSIDPLDHSIKTPNQSIDPLDYSIKTPNHSIDRLDQKSSVQEIGVELSDQSTKSSNQTHSKISYLFLIIWNLLFLFLTLSNGLYRVE